VSLWTEELKKAEEGALQEATQREEEAPKKKKTPSITRTGKAKEEIKGLSFSGLRERGKGPQECCYSSHPPTPAS
jgi:hypothetical protein